MNKEDIEKLKQSLFYDYSWSSKEIENFSMHIYDVIEATEQAINFTGSSLELRKKKISFDLGGSDGTLHRAKGLKCK
tara:strand:- start:48 stop:278 length:231 start_codon:yes stop_codon:yes gene_type:complete